LYSSSLSSANPLLSICIITRNEEQFIAGCLQSVLPIADEIIVVDSFSTDSTHSICLKHGVSFYSRKWTNDYSAARNYAIEKAKGKWILFLDADERVTGARQLLAILKKEKSKQTGAFLMERKDVFLHRENHKIDYYPVGIIRLFRNQSDIRFSYKIHEQLNKPLFEQGYKVKILPTSKLTHLVSDSSPAFLDKKQTYYLKLLNQSLKETKEEPWLLYQKAKTLWYFNKPGEASKIFDKLAIGKLFPLDIRTSSYNNRAILYMQEGEYKQALRALAKSIALIDGQSMAYFIGFNIRYEMQQFKRAIAEIQKVKTTICRCKWQQIIPGDLYCYPEIKSFKIGCCYLAAGDLKKAKFWFSKGLLANPQSADNHYGLSIVQYQAGTTKLALSSIRRCLKYNPEWIQAKQMQHFLKNV
jgi:glycosyltransferase involved in cell wall biosynthesis